MRKYLLFAFCLGIVALSAAQEDEVWKQASKESQAYHLYRLKLTRPPYGLQKIMAFLGKLRTDDNDQRKLSEKTYSSLTLREKFTYHMIHGESYSQNCDAMPSILDEHKKIFAELPDVFGEYEWSGRQKKFFNDNRDSIMKLMAESIEKTKRVELNFKHAIIEIDAKEMVPFLIRIYNIEKKDHDILTVLMLLMKNNKYEPFLSSASYRKLYADEDASYQASLNFNKANEDLIIKRASEFYDGLKK